VKEAANNASLGEAVLEIGQVFLRMPLEVLGLAVLIVWDPYWTVAGPKVRHGDSMLPWVAKFTNIRPSKVLDDIKKS
jgi:hypothetical protein